MGRDFPTNVNYTEARKPLELTAPTALEKGDLELALLVKVYGGSQVKRS